MQWHKQAGNITTSLKFKVNSALPTLSAINFVTCKYNVDDSYNGRNNMILGRYLLTSLGLNLTSSEHAIEADDGPFKGSITPMVDFGTYLFKDLNIGKFHLNNCLPMLMSQKYMSQNMYILLLNYYV